MFHRRGLVEVSYLKPNVIAEIQTEEGRFAANELPSGILVGDIDEITVSIVGHHFDGPSSLLARCDGVGGSSVERQALRDSGKGGDWLSEVMVPVRGQAVRLDFHRKGFPEQVCSALAFSIVHLNREVYHLRVPLRNVHPPKLANP